VIAAAVLIAAIVEMRNCDASDPGQGFALWAAPAVVGLAIAAGFGSNWLNWVGIALLGWVGSLVLVFWAFGSSCGG
jgi:hypothetical protein